MSHLSAFQPINHTRLNTNHPKSGGLHSKKGTVEEGKTTHRLLNTRRTRGCCSVENHPKYAAARWKNVHLINDVNMSQFENQLFFFYKPFKWPSLMATISSTTVLFFTVPSCSLLSRLRCALRDRVAKKNVFVLLCLRRCTHNSNANDFYVNYFKDTPRWKRRWDGHINWWRDDANFFRSVAPNRMCAYALVRPPFFTRFYSVFFSANLCETTKEKKNRNTDN